MTATWEELHSFGKLAMGMAYLMGGISLFFAYLAGKYRRKYHELKEKYNDKD